MHFINQNDQEVVIPYHSYVRVMEKVQESDQDICHADISAEPLNQHALSVYLPQSDLLPNQRQRLYNVV